MKNEFVQHIHDLLCIFAEVEFYRFFGGFGFKLGGIQFAMVMGNTLYFVVDSDLRDFFISMGSEPFSYKTKSGTKKLQRYYSVPDEILEDHEQLAAAQNQSVAFAIKTNYKSVKDRKV